MTPELPLYFARFIIADPNNNDQPVYDISAKVTRKEIAHDEYRFKQVLGKALSLYFNDTQPDSFRQQIKDEGYSFLDMIDALLEDDETFMKYLAAEGIFDLEHDAPIIDSDDWEAGDDIIDRQCLVTS